jgi:hypothetical protein
MADSAIGTSELATGAVTRAKLNGSEIPLYAIHDDCPSSGAPTFRDICASALCSSGPPMRFLNCSGDCILPGVATCSNPRMGYLLDENMP